jgi:hypothetical protein
MHESLLSLKIMYYRVLTGQPQVRTRIKHRLFRDLNNNECFTNIGYNRTTTIKHSCEGEVLYE